jgi:aerobic carbon-monoxide dehydrogenase medium subunit
VRSFEYHRADSVGQAVELLQRLGSDAHLMAGGTSLVLLLRQGLIQPGHVIDIRRLPELSGILRTADGGLEIGATTTHRQAETSADLNAYCPALTETFGHVATIRIRNQGTVGGNLAHADPAQDPPPMLLALGASVVARGPGGERVIPLDEFFVDYFETALGHDEVLTAIRCPPLAERTCATYVKFLPRTQDDYATVAVGATLRVDSDGRCANVQIGLGSLGTTPLRARKVESALLGQRLTPSLIADAAAEVRAEVDPLEDVRGSVGYKREMARVWVGRALTRLLENGRPG